MAASASHSQLEPTLVEMESDRQVEDRILHHGILDKLSKSSRYSDQFSSQEIQSLISNQQEVLQENQSWIEKSNQNLKLHLNAQLQSVRENRIVLDQIPDRIDHLEDEFLQLCSDLTGQQQQTRDEDGTPKQEEEKTDSSDQKSNPTLMQSLQSQINTLNSLKKAKDYFSILSKAQELKDEVLNPSKPIESALQNLTRLSQFVDRVVSLWINSTDSQLKILTYLKQEKNLTFVALRDRKLEELKKALESANWPPSNPVSESKRNDDSDDFKGENRGYRGRLKDNENVRKSWKEVCLLQKAAQRLNFLPTATILTLPLISDSNSPENEINPSDQGKEKQNETPLAGSDEYIPILAVQALLSPLLLRFKFHFDSERNTNRLDKPEWYLTHILNLIKSQSPLFQPIFGDVARLCARGGLGSQIDTSKELLDSLLKVLRIKLKSSLDLLSNHNSLLAHTVSETLKFDQELRVVYPSARNGCVLISNEILDNEVYFEKWLEGERLFSEERLDEILESSNAWILTKDGMDDEEQSTWSNLISAMGMEDDSNEDENPRENAQSSEDFTISPSNVNEIPTTKSARSLIELIESITERYSSLPSIKQKMSFITRIQLPLLRTYLTRLNKSLGSFESLSSAFSRSIPGGIDSTGIKSNSDSDMVKGLRGLGRLLKSFLSSNHVVNSLRKWSESILFLDLSYEIRRQSLVKDPSNASKLRIDGDGNDWLEEIKKMEDEEDDKELREASLTSLLRRGLRSGTGAARNLRPLGSRAKKSTTTFTSTRISDQDQLNQLDRDESKEVDSLLFQEDEIDENSNLPSVWDEILKRFQLVEKRAAKAIEKLVISEVLEVMREYSQSSWDDENKSDHASASPPASPEDNSSTDFELSLRDEVPTKSLIPSLSTLSTHLSHFAPILPVETRIPIFRNISKEISNAIVEKVVMAGGSHRFDSKGSLRFSSDVSEGWLGVISEILRAPSGSSNSVVKNRRLLLGKRPQAPWKYLLDVATLISLPTSTSTSSASTTSTTGTSETKRKEWTLSKATRAVFDEDEQDDVKGFAALKRDLDLDEDFDRRIAREILRRRIECWK